MRERKSFAWTEYEEISDAVDIVGDYSIVGLISRRVAHTWRVVWLVLQLTGKFEKPTVV